MLIIFGINKHLSPAQEQQSAKNDIYVRSLHRSFKEDKGKNISSLNMGRVTRSSTAGKKKEEAKPVAKKATVTKKKAKVETTTIVEKEEEANEVTVGTSKIVSIEHCKQ